MEQWLLAISGNWSYLALVAILVLSGFGLPVPEDIPLLVGGYLCGIGQAELAIMLPLLFSTVLGADLIVFYLGRRFGHHIPRLPLMKRFLNEKTLAASEASFHRHGGKALFIARFVPGIRAATFFTAGTFKMPAWKMIAFDGGAAVLSVPALVILGWWGAEQFEHVKHFAAEVQLIIAVILVTVVASYVSWKFLRRRKRFASAQS